MKDTNDMTKGTPWKLIVSFAVPVFLSNLFQQLYNSADSIIVGNFLGTTALAAVSSSGNLIFLFTSFFIGCALGSTVVIAKYFGEKSYDDVKKAVHTTVSIGLVAAIIVSIFGYIFAPTMLVLMNTDPEVLPESIEYFRVFFLGVGGSILYSFLNAILQGVGNSKKGLEYLIISSLTNIALDLILVGIFKFGVWSAALATGFSHYLSAILCFIYLVKKDTIYKINLKEIKFDKALLKEILYNGIPSGIMNSVIGLANVVVLASINKFGKIAQAGYGTFTKIEGFAFLPITCFNMALTTYVGQNLGAKEYERAKRGSKFGVLISIIMAEIVGITMFFSGGYVARLFTSDLDVCEYTKLQSMIACPFYFLLAYSHAIASVCRGASKGFVPMLVMLIVWCLIRVSYITIIMSFYHDIRLIYWAYPITWTISSIIYFIYYNFSDWIHGFEHKKKRYF